MKTLQASLIVCAALSLALANPAHGFELRGSTTEVRAQGGAVPSVSVEFETGLPNDLNDLMPADLTVVWRQAGGIVPCVRIYIPAGCFVGSDFAGSDFHVEDFEACGVQVTNDLLDGRPVDLRLIGFEARFRQSRLKSDVFLFTTEMLVADPYRNGELLGTIGGAEVVVGIGSETAVGLPESVSTASSPRR